MNLHALRLFYVAAQHQSISQAAEILNISQPSVTAQIKALERFYQVDLFVRKGRNVVLTDLGRTVYSEAMKLFSIEAHIESLLEHESITETLRLDGSRLVMNHLLPQKILAYRKKMPLTRLEIQSHHRDAVIENVLNYRADVGFIGCDQGIEGLLVYPLMEDELILVAAASFEFTKPLIPSCELQKHCFYTTQVGSNLRNQLDALFPNLKPEQHVFFSDIYELLEYLVLDDSAIALCSRSIVQAKLDSGTLIELPTDLSKMHNAIAAVIRKRDAKTQSIRRFLEFLNIENTPL